jgi:hypothetical protein
LILKKVMLFNNIRSTLACHINQLIKKPETHV